MSKTKNTVPSSENQLGTRIRAVVDLFESRKSAALSAGVSADMLSRYMRGDSQPAFSVMANLCKQSGVSISWLASGQGVMLTSEAGYRDLPREDMLHSAAGDAEAEARLEQRHKSFKTNLETPRAIVDEAFDVADLQIDNHWKDMIASVINRYQIDPQDVSDLVSLVKSEAGITSEFALIPGYNIQVAAGTGAFPDQEQPTRKLAFRHKWLRYRGLKEKDLVLVFAKGDSMEPTISDNNTLMIDTSERELMDGSIYVIRTNSHLIVKRVQTLWNKGILLLSDNKEYETQQVEPNESDDLEVIGKVVWIGKDL